MTSGRPLRVLLSAYACEPNRGSEPGVGWQWAIGLATRGYDVWVLTRRNNRQAIEEALVELPEERRRHLNFVYYDLPRWASRWKRGLRGVQLYYALWQRGAVRVAHMAHAAHGFDLVHHLTFGVWRQPSLMYKLGVPFLFGPVGGGETPPRTLIRTLPLKARIGESLRVFANWMALLNPSLRTSIASAAVVAARTPETAQWLMRAGARNVSVSPDIGIDHCVTQMRRGATAREPLRCLYVGNLLALKGVHLAIEAIALAVARGADIKFTIVGRGPMRSRLQALANRLGLGDRVTFTGWLNQSDVFDRYGRHDLFLFPSLHDSGGTVVLEAFAHGLPVVCFKLGGPGYWVMPDTGAAVPPNGASSLSDALLSLARDRDRLERLAQGALAKARDATWNAAIDAVYRRATPAVTTLRIDVGRGIAEQGRPVRAESFKDLQAGRCADVDELSAT